MTVSPKKIILKGDPIYKERPLKALDNYDNGKIMPGMLCEYDGIYVKPHATADGFASAIFAVELAIREGADINTLYDQDGETVELAFCRPGDEVYALLDIGENVAAGALLNSGGNGHLDSTVSTYPVARALEAVNNSAGTAAARIRVEVL